MVVETVDDDEEEEDDDAERREVKTQIKVRRGRNSSKSGPSGMVLP